MMARPLHVGGRFAPAVAPRSNQFLSKAKLGAAKRRRRARPMPYKLKWHSCAVRDRHLSLCSCRGLASAWMVLTRLRQFANACRNRLMTSDGLSGLPRFRTLGKQSGRLCAVVPLVQKRSERPNHLSLLTRAKIRRSSAAYCKSVLQDLPHRPDIQTLQSHRLRGFAQLEFLHLAGRGFGDFCKHHIARTFVAGEVRTAPGDQLFGGGA